jgi:hypothetical protein
MLLQWLLSLSLSLSLSTPACSPPGGFGTSISYSRHAESFTEVLLRTANKLIVDGDEDDDDDYPQYLAVGAPGRDRVYVFTGQDGVFSDDHVTIRKPSGGGCQFGSTVHISGDGNLLVVGAPDWGNGGGYVYVYKREGGVCEYPRSICAPARL